MWRRARVLSVGAVILERVESKAATRTDSALAARLAASASLGAAVIHFAVAPAHWQEWMPSGLFFIVLALFQLVWARMILVRRTTAVLAAGITFNIGALALWALSRTAGAPFGPHAGEPEFVQAADLCALLLQLYVVMGAGWVWYRGQEADPIPAFVNAMVFVGFGIVVALASTAGVISGMGHGHHGPAATEPDHPNIVHTEDHRGHAEPATVPRVVVTPAAPAPAVAPPAAVPLHDHAEHHS